MNVHDQIKTNLLAHFNEYSGGLPIRNFTGLLDMLIADSLRVLLVDNQFPYANKAIETLIELKETFVTHDEHEVKTVEELVEDGLFRIAEIRNETQDFEDDEISSQAYPSLKDDYKCLVEWVRFLYIRTQTYYDRGHIHSMLERWTDFSKCFIEVEESLITA